jgi:SAM-dependent methyltransferase
MTQRSAAAAERNLPHILDVLSHFAPAEGAALELASGTGQHIAAFAKAHLALHWQASDVNPDNLASITAWAEGIANLAQPVVLDATRPGWSEIHRDKALIILVNLLHLISDAAADTVLDEAARALAPGGRLMLYGPFLRDGQTTSPGDAQFHASLRAQNAAIGYKDLAHICDRLKAAGLRPVITEMPANNLMLTAFNN